MSLEVHAREEQHHKDGHSMMLELAEQLEEHYTRPLPAASYQPNIFPKQLDWGIFWGLLLGALLGIFVAWLVHSGQWTPPGWEGLFSLVPFSFYAFFVFAAAAAGLLVGGTGTLLAAPAPELNDPQHPDQRDM